MYDSLLDTFISVADSGSFSKTADLMYISPTAVMKQMNSLEDKLGLVLLERKKSGVTLTTAGEMLYKDARFIVEYSKKAVAEAMAASDESQTTFCVGTSLLNQAKPFMELWYKASREFADYKLHIVPFEDNHEGILAEIKALGKKFDFLIGVCDSDSWMSICSFLPLGRYKKMVAVPREHRLADRDRIDIEELYGETLMMVCRGDSPTNDRIRDELETNHRQIHIEDTAQHYDLSVFNRCAETGNILLTLDCWRDVHPGLVTIPVNWDYTIPYGLMYSKNPPEDVLRFVETIQR